MTTNELMAFCRTLRGLRLNLTEYAILRRLEEEGDWVQLLTLKEELGLTSSAVSLAVQGLEVPHGYVAKARGQDERTVWACLTEAGAEVLREVQGSKVEVAKQEKGK